MEACRAAVESAAKKHACVSRAPIEYGTAGFRCLATSLDHVMFRMGLLAVIRSQSCKGAAVGVMITASHNPLPDNGVKLVDPGGEMLHTSWEQRATRLANTSDDDLFGLLCEIVREEQLDCQQSAVVIVARDNRPSGEALLEAVLGGVTALGGQYRDLGVTTTPLLHYMVHASNSVSPPSLSVSTNVYYETLSSAFKQLNSQSDCGDYHAQLVVDAANGVGAGALAVCTPLLAGLLHVQVYNDSGQLNHQCGADYVKIQQCAPANMPLSPLARCASFDGDADRLIYFYVDDQGGFHMLDGDRIATLIAGYLKELLEVTGLQLSLGLVQTAYANGNSTRYITEQLRVPVCCVPTGVKHLHSRALHYDIGVYFEANGHGTAVFSQTAAQQLQQLADTCHDQHRRQAAERLCCVARLVNQTVGDALSDLLLVETVLRARRCSVTQWHRVYRDLPCRQLKIAVPDRSLITTSDAERKCVSPAGLQQQIDSLVEQYPSGRAFVRPSGTENVVRVYAEADSQTNADHLANRVAEAVREHTH